jgi:hypothetical protein
VKRFILALLAAVAAGHAFAAPAIVQVTEDEWIGDSTTSPDLVFGSNITAGNSIICAIALYDGADQGITNVVDTQTNTYAVPNDSSSGDADSGVASLFTRSYITAAHNAAAGATTVTANVASANLYGHFACWEVSGLAATPNDRACSVQDTFPQASDATCTIGTLSQAEEFVVAVMANIDDADNNLNISGPTGGPGSWTNEAIYQDPTARVGYSIDYGTTAATTTFNAQYSHDDLSAHDWSIAVATFEAAAGGASQRRRRMN